MAEKEQRDTTSMSEEERELGTRSIGSLFYKYMLVTLIGMGAQAVMVIFEGIIIGNGLGQFGLAVIGIIMPLELLNLALGAMLTMGIATVAGNRLGAGDLEGARKAFSQGFWFSAYVVIAIAALIFIFAPQVASVLGATPDLMEGSTHFIRIFMLFYPFCILGQMLAGVLRVDEKPGLSSATMFISAGLALAWLYVSVMFIGLGITGAAIYYGTSIGLWFLVIFYFLFNRKTIFKIRVSDMKVDGALARQIITIGMPSFLVQAASVVYTVVVNNSLGTMGGDLGELQIAAFSLLNGYIVYIINMMWQCAQYGVQPIAAFNYGARDYGRLKKLIKVSLAGTFGIVLGVSALFIIFAKPICGIFAGDAADLVALAAQNTLPLCLLACFGTLANIMSTYFQAVDKVGRSIIIGISRYVFFTIPAVLIMSAIMGIDGVWWAQPVGDACTFVFMMVFVVRELHHLTALERGQGHDTAAAGA